VADALFLTPKHKSFRNLIKFLDVTHY
jgi:hypothetical protein